MPETSLWFSSFLEKILGPTSHQLIFHKLLFIFPSCRMGWLGTGDLKKKWVYHLSLYPSIQHSPPAVANRPRRKKTVIRLHSWIRVCVCVCARPGLRERCVFLNYRQHAHVLDRQSGGEGLNLPQRQGERLLKSRSLRERSLQGMQKSSCVFFATTNEHNWSLTLRWIDSSIDCQLRFECTHSSPWHSVRKTQTF